MSRLRRHGLAITLTIPWLVSAWFWGTIAVRYPHWRALQELGGWYSTRGSMESSVEWSLNAIDGVEFPDRFYGSRLATGLEWGLTCVIECYDPITSFQFRDCATPAAAFRRMSALGGAPQVSITNCQLSQDDLACFQSTELRRVKRIELHEVQVAPGGLNGLRACTALRHLSLTESICSSIEIVAILKDLQELETLNLTGTPLDFPDSEGDVTSPSTLRRLDLCRCACTTADVDRLLRHLPLLESLDLSDTSVDSGVAESLAACRPLEYLTLSGTRIDDRFLSALDGQGGQLSWLTLNRTNVTDAGVRATDVWSRLEHLDLTETAVTGDGLAHVARLIKCRIELEPRQFSREFLGVLAHSRGADRRLQLYVRGIGHFCTKFPLDVSELAQVLEAEQNDVVFRSQVLRQHLKYFPAPCEICFDRL